jgi:DNA-binding NarL/FixJ family response regulator
VVVVPGPSVLAGGANRLGVDGGPNLLLIDHQPLFLAALSSLLTAPPVRARVQIAHSSDSGLETVLAGGVHLVFCEVRADPIPAVELATRLGHLTTPVPVILLGEPEDERLLVAALHSSVAGVFTKDATLDEFLVGVQTVLSGHRAVGSNLMRVLLSRLADGAPNDRRTVSRLSPTELEILTMIGEAKSIAVIASARGISHKTVRNHLANIYRKLELRSRTEAMLYAARTGLTVTTNSPIEYDTVDYSTDASIAMVNSSTNTRSDTTSPSITQNNGSETPRASTSKVRSRPSTITSPMTTRTVASCP